METYFSLNIDNQLKTKRGQTEVKTTENMFTMLFCPDINVKNYPLKENVYYVTHRKLFG